MECEKEENVGCHLLTYLLTPWNTVLLKKLTGSAASKEILHIFWNPKVHHRTHKCPPPVRILSQLHPVPTTLSQFLKIHLNIIFPSASGFPQRSLSLRFPHQKEAWGSVVVKALRYYSDGPGSIPGGVTGDFFRGTPDRTMCPEVDPASESEYQKFLLG